MAYYGTLSEANDYFDARLHSEGWSDSTTTDRPKALTEATRIIDSLNFKGVKNSVYLVMYDSDDVLITVDAPDRDAIIVADVAQVLEFPRGKDTSVPEEIEWACYEFALALLEGFTPEDATDQLRIIRQSYASVRTTYAEGSDAIEHLVYGVPTAQIWRWLKPRMIDDRTIRLSRAD